MGVEPSASDTRQLCQRMATEEREARISTLQFAIALAIVFAGLAIFAGALLLL